MSDNPRIDDLSGPSYCIFEDFQVRKTKKQKTKFINYVKFGKGSRAQVS